MISPTELPACDAPKINESRIQVIGEEALCAMGQDLDEAVLEQAELLSGNWAAA